MFRFAAGVSACSGQAPHPVRRGRPLLERAVDHAQEGVGLRRVEPAGDDDEVAFRVDPDRIAAGARRLKRPRRRAWIAMAAGVEPPEPAIDGVDRRRRRRGPDIGFRQQLPVAPAAASWPAIFTRLS